jgi:hypothetical protein
MWKDPLLGAINLLLWPELLMKIINTQLGLEKNVLDSLIDEQVWCQMKLHYHWNPASSSSRDGGAEAATILQIKHL